MPSTPGKYAPDVARVVYVGADALPVTAYNTMVTLSEVCAADALKSPAARTVNNWPLSLLSPGTTNAPLALVADGVSGEVHVAPALYATLRPKYFTAVPVPPTFDGNPPFTPKSAIA